MGVGGGLGWVVGKSDFKENSKSDLDLDLGFVNKSQHSQDEAAGAELGKTSIPG